MEQPNSVIAPIGTRIQLNCSVVQGYGIDWEIRLNNADPLSTGTPRLIEPLRNLGIEVLQLSSTRSYLVINGTEENSQISVVCKAFQQNSITEMRSRESQVIFHGKPGIVPIFFYLL